MAPSPFRSAIDDTAQPKHQHFARRTGKLAKAQESSTTRKTNAHLAAANNLKPTSLAGKQSGTEGESRKRVRDYEGESPAKDLSITLKEKPEAFVDTSDGGKGVALWGFRQDDAPVTIHDFSDRMHDIVYTVCVSNRKKEQNAQDKDCLLFQDEVVEMSLPDLVDRLVKWPGSSRSVSVVALIIMDRIQTAVNGVVVNFDTVSKVFTMCMLLARKVLEDKAV